MRTVLIVTLCLGLSTLAMGQVPRVPVIVDQLKAPAGRASIEIGSPLTFKNGGDTMPYANLSLRPLKQFGSGAALLGGVADFGGQLLVTSDGVAFSIARGTGAGETAMPVVLLNSLLYVYSLEVTTALNADSSGTGLGHRFTASGGFCDNVISIANYTGGFASLAGFRPQDASIIPTSAAAFALGYGPGSTRGSPGVYNDRVYLGLSPKGSTATADPPDYVVGGESDKGSGYLGRELMLFDGVGKTWTIRGWSDSAVQGPLGVRVESSGVATIGTLLRLTPRMAPGTPVNGDVYVDSGDNHVYARVNGSWKQLDN